jgi:hypothetical protein
VWNWSKKEFIAWDGEGLAVDEPVEISVAGEPWGYHWPGERDIFFEYERQVQPYVLLANSKGQDRRRQEGLGTEECLEFLLETKQQYPESIFVGFGFNYDINQILKDLRPGNLWALHDRNRTYWDGYMINWLPHKSLSVSHKRSGRKMILYDTFGFFQSSFLLTCQKYLGTNDPELETIREGKTRRTEFSWKELESYIIPYNKTELSMLVRIMNILRADLHSVDIHPGQWHGPGAVANKVLTKFNVIITRDIPEEVQDASQFAYAGGRFEQFYVGRYDGPVYEDDIRSAYPAAASTLPDLSDGAWEHVEGFQPDSFGVWYIEYQGPGDNRPKPLFCRAEGGTISFPNQVSGWYWGPEANLCPDYVREGYVFHPRTDSRPFSFIEEMFDARRVFKQQGSSSERALKLVMNSIPGKLAQSVGGRDGPPRWHQFEYAGYITSFTRAMIYQAIQLNPDAIIAAETDAVFSMEPLDLPHSDNLGDWERKEYDGITYLQSGYYYALKGEEIVCKYRGMDRDGDTGQPYGLPYREVLDHLRNQTGFCYRPTPSLRSYTTRFIGLGLGLRTNSEWRTWERKPKKVSLDQRDGSSKRIHVNTECFLCRNKITMYDALHPLTISGYYGESFARQLPWRQVAPLYQRLVMNMDWRDFGEDMEKWQ